eukprot:GILI01023557.1.p1 GENE.GILI01023557.1~~GILI01023557.1.p1  ORF type:complete len:437 (-),score=68.46 GILI01023557.1:195-1457(-)
MTVECALLPPLAVTDETATVTAVAVPPVNCDFLLNSVWPALYELLTTKLSSCFSLGLADLFHRNFLASLNFLDRYERFFAFAEDVKRFRETASYNDFLKKWNVAVYFQLRFQEIAGDAETAMSQSVTELERDVSKRSQGGAKADGMILSPFVVTWNALMRCWHAEVFLPAVSQRLLRLSLQLVSRLRHWLTNTVNTSESVPVGVLSSILHDLDLLKQRLSTSLIPAISVHKLGDEFLEVSRSCLQVALSSLGQAGAPCLQALVGALLTQCTENLQAVRGLTHLYRMTGRPSPTHPSAFAASVVKPLETFLNSYAPLLSESVRVSVFSGVLSVLCSQYSTLATELLAGMRQTEMAVRKINRRAANQDANETASILDSDKVAQQLYLDVEEMGRQLVSMGHDTSTDSSYQGLLEQVSQARKV